MEHDESKLPRWAQKRLARLRMDNRILAHALETTRSLAALLCEPKREWFTIDPPASGDDQEGLALWSLARNHPVKVCSLASGDILFVGRARHASMDEVEAEYQGEGHAAAPEAHPEG